MAKTPRPDKAVIGACGEHYIAAFLSRHQLVVALPRAGVKGSDLFVADADFGHPIRIQVKTGTDSRRTNKKQGIVFYEWHASFPTTQQCNESTWYAFVWLSDWPEKAVQPELFFVPSIDVAANMTETGQDSTTPYATFWMPEGKLSRYRGSDGLELMLRSMKKTPCTDGESIQLK